MWYCSDGNIKYNNNNHCKHLTTNRRLRNVFLFEFIHKIEKRPVKTIDLLFRDLMWEY